MCLAPQFMRKATILRAVPCSTRANLNRCRLTRHLCTQYCCQSVADARTLSNKPCTVGSPRFCLRADKKSAILPLTFFAISSSTCTQQNCRDIFLSIGRGQFRQHGWSDTWGKMQSLTVLTSFLAEKKIC